MNNKTYKVIINYGLEGWKFLGEDEHGDSFIDLDEAVKEAVAVSYGSEFMIVQVINWKAKDENQT